MDPNCQESRESVRKRTFTRWINEHLKKFDPSLQVNDLYTDVQDGKILMALLEKLSGYKMLYRFRPSIHHIFTLSNIAKVLEFLEDRNVRVMSIDAADIAVGKPLVVLALIWNIIVYFQLKEVTGGLERRFSSSVSSLIPLADSSDSGRSSPVASSDEHSSTLPSKKKLKSRKPKYYRSRAISTLLNWTQTCTAPYGVEVQDFGKSWRNGLAFLALVKYARPELVDMTAALTSTPRENITQAFRTAQDSMGIPQLLDPEDVIMPSPDEQSVITYVSQFLQNFPEIRDDDALMCPEDNFSPIGEYSDCKKSSSSQEFLEDIEGFSDFTNEPNKKLDFSLKKLNTPPSYHCLSSTALFNARLSAEQEESIQLNEKYLHSSTEGQCWSSLSQQEIWGIDNRGLSLGSEEGIHILPELDSEEDEAYSYILKLDHEECLCNNEPKCSTDFNAQEIYHDFGSFYHINGEQYIYSPIEIQKQTLQLSSEASTYEEHRPEGELSYINNTEDHHRQDELDMVTPTGPDLCILNDNLNMEDIHNIAFLYNEVTLESIVSERTLSRSNSFSKEESLHTMICNNMDNQSLTEMRLKKSALTQEDEISKVKEPTKNSLLEDYPQSRSLTYQSNLSSAEEESSATSETAKDLSVAVLGDAMNSELLHTVLLLWILTYCIFILPQLETWILF